MIYTLLPYLTLWVVFLTLGLVYLMTEADLTEKLRVWLQRPADVPPTIVSLSDVDTQEDVPPVTVSAQTESTARQDVSSTIVSLYGTQTASEHPQDVPPTIVSFSTRLRCFAGRITLCQMCSAAYAGLAASCCVVGFTLSLVWSLWYIVVPLAVITTPPTFIGVVWTLDRLSPVRASDRIVDTGVDIAQEILTLLDTKQTTDKDPGPGKREGG